MSDASIAREHAREVLAAGHGSVTRTLSQECDVVAGTNTTRNDTEDRALAEYRSHVKATADGRRVALVNNSSPAHFVIVMAQLFEFAQHHVRIYSNHLSRFSRTGHSKLADAQIGQPVWASDSIIAAATRFLENENTRLDIIVRYELDADNGDLRTHPFLRSIVENESRRGSVTLRVANEVPSKLSKMFPQNFVVVDDQAYRHELNGDAIRAVVQFGNDGSAELFVRSFRRMARDIDERAASHSNSRSFYYPVGSMSLNDPLSINADGDERLLISSPETLLVDSAPAVSVA